VPNTGGGGNSGTSQPAGGGTAAAANDRAAIQQTLNRLSSAYASLDPTQVAAVWPTLSANQLDSLKQSFRETNSYALSVQNCVIEEAGARATAACDVSRTINFKVQGTRKFDARITYQLEKRGGTWVIIGQK
jgi:hypothetical protein